jgi:enamine deaminase RidA (YjgF/YER057c/UK114 family)
MKSVFRSKRIPAPGSNYSPGVNVNNLLFMSGLLATDYKTGIPPQAKTNPNFPWFGSNVKLQAEYVLNNLGLLMEDAGSSLEDILRMDVYMLDVNDYFEFSEVLHRYFPNGGPPQNIVGVKNKDTFWGQGLLGSVGDRFEVDAIAIAPKEDFTKRAVPTPGLSTRPDRSPLAAAAGDYLFTSGLLATDYKTGIPVTAKADPNFPWMSSDVKLQTVYVLDQLKAILSSVGTSLDNVVKANVFLLDLKDYWAFKEVWDEYFPKNEPAKTVLKGSGLLGAKGDRVQVEAIAIIPGGKRNKRVIHSQKIPGPSEECTLAVEAGGMLCTSGLMATDYKTGIPVGAKTDPNRPWIGSDIKYQVQYTLDNLKTLLEEAGCSMNDVAKINVYLTDLRDFSGFTELLPRYFTGTDQPARTAFEVEEILGPTGARFEVEAIAAID